MFELHYQQKIEEITHWIQNTLKNAGFQKVVVAVSGGVDSAVSLYLVVRALGRENVYALLLPHGKLSEKSLTDGKLVATSAGLSKDHIFVRDVEPAAKALAQEAGEMSDIRMGNMMARVRMIYLFDLAKARNALVIGTENKTEHYLGYFTRFGDEASDVEPIRSLYKTQVFALAEALGVPKEIISKAPSANLWEGQSDEEEFGFSYKDADRILFHYFEEELPREGIIDLGFDAALVDVVLSLVKKNDFKHHVPYIFE